jgi:DNA polymerase III epsilon subunit-like protein
MVTDAVTFTEVYPRIDAALKDKRVLIYYNSVFDIKILNYCCPFHT